MASLLLVSLIFVPPLFFRAIWRYLQAAVRLPKASKIITVRSAVSTSFFDNLHLVFTPSLFLALAPVVFSDTSCCRRINLLRVQSSLPHIGVCSADGAPL